MEDEPPAPPLPWLRFSLLSALLWAISPWLLPLAFWYLALLRLEHAGILDRWNATRVLGIVLMVRTRHGRRALDCIATPRRLWRAFGEGAIWLCVGSMSVVVLLLLLAAVASIMSPPSEPLAASDVILIPGVTGFVPLWWPLLALVVALVIHEYGHGLQARAHGMQIRSFGLLMAGPLPVGAFAEPEGQELVTAPRRERLRLYAAGPAVNIVTSFLFFLLIAAVCSQFTATTPGAHASGIVSDAPAEAAGLQPYETIIAADGEMIGSAADMSAFLSSHSANDSVTLTVVGRPMVGGGEREVVVSLADRYEYEIERGTDPEILALYGIEPGDGFLGVSGMADGTVGADRLAGPLRSGDISPIQRLFGLIVHPLTLLTVPLDHDGHIMHAEEQALVTIDSSSPLSIIGTAKSISLLEALFWMVWINMLLGFANLVPMIPFDGGHMMTDLVHSAADRINRRFGGWHPLRVERFARVVSGWSSLVMLLIFALPVVLSMLA